MKNNPSFLCRYALLTLVLSVSTASILRADERLQNPGFESGSFTPGWTFNDPSTFTNIGGNPAFAHSGTFHANLGASPNTGTLSQTFSTVAGAMYQISFWLANDGIPPTNSFVASFNGVAFVTLANQAPSSYTLFSANLLATGASSTLMFQYRNDDDFWRLDDVSVNGPAPAATVPEHGSTLWLALPAFAGLLLTQHRLGKRSQSATA